LRAYVNGVLYSFAVIDSNSTDVAYSRGPSAAAELLVEQTNTLKHVKLQMELSQTTEQLRRTNEELNATRQHLSDVVLQELLTVAEQMTAATQQSALQGSDNSEQQQPTTDTGKPIDSCAVQYPLNGTIHDYVLRYESYRKVFNRDLRIGRLRSNRIRIESGVTIRIRIEYRIESAVYDISLVRPTKTRRTFWMVTNYVTSYDK